MSWDNQDLKVEAIISYMMGDRGGTSFEWMPPEKGISDQVVLNVEHMDINERVRDISFNLHKGEVIGFAGL